MYRKESPPNHIARKDSSHCELRRPIPSSAANASGVIVAAKTVFRRHLWMMTHPSGETSASDNLSFDFAVNTMTYQPGAALSMVEMHVMEHGLVMLEGGGIYRLADAWYPVTAAISFGWVHGARNGSERSETARQIPHI